MAQIPLYQAGAAASERKSALASLDNRGVALFCVLAICTHIALTGGRVTVALGALAQGSSSFTVGVLVALFALLPMLVAVHTGRWVDRIGVRLPMRIGASLLIFGSALPALIADARVLFISSCATGIGCMLFQIATQNLMGQGDGPDRRIQNFSKLSLSMSISGFSGPLIAGIAIDNVGYRWAFAVLTLFPLIALIVLLRQRRSLPHTLVLSKVTSKVNATDLLTHPMVRRVLIATVLLAGAWDLNAFMVPIFGTAIGLSATTIGVILSAFAAATFVIRVMLPWIQRRMAPWTLLRTAMLCASVVYLAYPFFEQVPILIALAFLLGLALGSGQPSLLSLLHTYAPPGRAAEALGMRMALINGGQFVLPLTFGAISTISGIGLPFWTVAACLLAGGLFNRPPKTDPQIQAENETGLQDRARS